MDEQKERFTYIGRMPCGCVMAAQIDDGNKKSISKGLSEMVGDGMYIERVSLKKFREEISKEINFFSCPHLKESK